MGKKRKLPDAFVKKWLNSSFTGESSSSEPPNPSASNSNPIPPISEPNPIPFPPSDPNIIDIAEGGEDSGDEEPESDEALALRLQWEFNREIPSIPCTEAPIVLSDDSDDDDAENGEKEKGGEEEEEEEEEEKEEDSLLSLLPSNTSGDEGAAPTGELGAALDAAHQVGGEALPLAALPPPSAAEEKKDEEDKVPAASPEDAAAEQDPEVSTSGA